VIDLRSRLYRYAVTQTVSLASCGVFEGDRGNLGRAAVLLECLVRSTYNPRFLAGEARFADEDYPDFRSHPVTEIRGGTDMLG